MNKTIDKQKFKIDYVCQMNSHKLTNFVAFRGISQISRLLRDREFPFFLFVMDDETHFFYKSYTHGANTSIIIKLLRTSLGKSSAFGLRFCNSKVENNLPAKNLPYISYGTVLAAILDFLE